ncbi:MAG: c-type cytochrome [Terracidiphilus sp.]|jgi:mono/diheme cytochrome c family protein
MLNRLLVIAVAATLATGMSYADQSKSKVTIPVTKTTASSGKQMYSSYCAPCHGVDARGQGPVASALRTPPMDLTVLSRNNHGKFPDTHIVSVLQNGAEIPSHGSAEMPVWGPILGKMNQTNPQDRLLRISNLSRYLESVQVK